MTQEAKILVVDDDPAFLAMYRDILGEEGYLVATATDRASAVAALAQGLWSAVLLDQKLQGPSGPDSGLDLIDEARLTCPEAQVLIVSGYATSASVERAFDAGAYDFLEKSDALPALLRLKLRSITSLYRAREQARIGRDELHQLLTAAQSEPDRHRKGKLFEDFVVALFQSLPDLGAIASVRRRSDVEEIDVLLRNAATQPPWNREGAYLLVECKNWSRPVDRPEYDAFRLKILRRRGRCTLGFFLAVGGFTGAFHEVLRRDAHQEPYVLPLDLEAIRRLIDADDRLAELSRLHLDVTMEPSAK